MSEVSEKIESGGGNGGGVFRKSFAAGLLLCLPVSLTVYIIVWLVNLMASPARGALRFFFRIFDVELQPTPLADAGVTVLSALIVAAAITCVGFISRNLFGRLFISALENIVARLPMVRSIYSAIKQIIDTFSVGGKERTFSRVVLVEFPRRGSWTLGFLTHEGETQFSRAAGTRLAHVFVPTTPNPTGGYMILVPADEVKALDVSVAEAMKMIVSGGAVVPEEKTASPAFPPTGTDAPAGTGEKA